MSFITIKVIDCRQYCYEQTPERVGGKLRPKSSYLGPRNPRRCKQDPLDDRRELVVWIDPDMIRAMDDPEGCKAQQERQNAEHEALVRFLGIKEDICAADKCDICKDKRAPPRRVRPRLPQRQKVDLFRSISEAGISNC